MVNSRSCCWPSGNLIITNLNVQTAAYELINVSPTTWYIETYAISATP